MSKKKTKTPKKTGKKPAAKRTAAKDKRAKTTGQSRAKKAKGPDRQRKPKRVSALAAAAQVLAKAEKPMGAQQLIAAINS